MIVLPVRIIMSPTSSRRFLTGKNPRSATERTKFCLPFCDPVSSSVCHGRRACQPVTVVLHGYPTCARVQRRWYVPASDGVGEAAHVVCRSAGGARRDGLRRRRAAGQERAVGHLRRRRRAGLVPAHAARRTAVA